MKLKVCGATKVDEVHDVADAGADYVGLWTGMGNHPRNLDNDSFVRLANECGDAKPVAVCVKFDPDPLCRLMDRAGVRIVQMHGFTLPAGVKLMKERGFTVIKVLHIADDGAAPEARWLPAFAHAGVDIFLLDRHGRRGEIGSTGKALPVNTVRRWVKRLGGERLWLAGGLTADRILSLDVASRVEAADVDSAARIDGRLAYDSVAMLSAAVALKAHQMQAVQ